MVGTGYLNQNKGLIKDALEIYLNQSSSFLSEQMLIQNPVYFKIPADYQITSLTEPTVPEYDSTGQLSPVWKEYLTKQK
ncbi:9781_t:CDS:2 [Funneliformis geosporum]|nr:9781_t:CDS:2 [Funneliformis geosporum]